MRRFRLVSAVLLAGCASLHNAPPPPRWTQTPVAQAKSDLAEETGKPPGATWRLKPVGTMDAMRSAEEEAAMPPYVRVANRLDPGLSSAGVFHAYWWGESLEPAGLIVYPAGILLLAFPLRLRLGLKLPPRWQ